LTSGESSFGDLYIEGRRVGLSASRGRSEIAIVTGDRHQLRESPGVSSARPSATELEREQTHSHQPKRRIQQTSAQEIESLRPRHEINTGHDIGLVCNRRAETGARRLSWPAKTASPGLLAFQSLGDQSNVLECIGD
jgi:hypothetical protein